MQITKKECLRCDYKMHQLDVCTHYAVGILFIVMCKQNRYMKKNNNVDLPTYFRKVQITKKECLRCDYKMHQLDVCTYFLENKLGLGAVIYFVL